MENRIRFFPWDKWSLWKQFWIQMSQWVLNRICQHHYPPPVPSLLTWGQFSKNPLSDYSISPSVTLHSCSCRMFSPMSQLPRPPSSSDITLHPNYPMAPSFFFRSFHYQWTNVSCNSNSSLHNQPLDDLYHFFQANVWSKRSQGRKHALGYTHKPEFALK